jgi:acetyltransferase
VDLVAGVIVDPDFGPLVLVGSGGVLAELVADTALAPAPLDEDGARALLASTTVSRLLDGYRGGPVYDRSAIERLLVQLSTAATELTDIEAIDLNPVRVLPKGAVALDALIITTSQGGSR